MNAVTGFAIVFGHAILITDGVTYACDDDMVFNVEIGFFAVVTTDVAIKSSDPNINIIATLI